MYEQIVFRLGLLLKLELRRRKGILLGIASLITFIASIAETSTLPHPPPYWQYI